MLDKNAKSVMSINDFLSGVLIGKWKHETEIIQGCKTKEERQDYKKKTASAVTVSGTFLVRNQNNLIEHSGFICIDFDDFDFTKYDDLKKDIYTYAAFKSVSGLGVAVIVRVNKEKHKESFQFLQRYYFTKYGCVIDSAPQNVASLRFISYDPELFKNEKSKVSGIYKEPEKKFNNSLPLVYGDSEVAELVRTVCNSGINLAPDYASYRDLAFSLADGFGSGASGWFHALCSVDSKYSSKDAEKQFNIALKGSGSKKIGVGTFYWMLKNAGVKLPTIDTAAQNVAMIAKKTKTTKADAVKQLIDKNGFDENRATVLIDEVYKRDDVDLKSMSKDPEKLVESLTFFMQSNWSIKKNIITGKYENDGEEINEEYFNSIFLKCRMAFGSTSVTWELTNTIMRSDFTEKYNPVKEWVNNNWFRNSTGNIDALCDSIVTDTDHYRLFIRKWLLCIAAALDGKPVRSVLALVGGQNSGKTEWFRRLLPTELLKYYAESKLDAGKDDDMLMCQKLIVMDDEMGGKSKQDEKRFKELTSKQTFSLRAPYARTNEDYKRLAVLCGTSNDKDVINDPTGNTRIFPVNIISLNHSKYNAINKDELLIEIIRAYKSGENYELTKDELIKLGLVSDKHTSETVEQGAIDKFFRNPKDVDIQVSYMTATDIKCFIEINSTIKINNTKKLSQHLIKTFGEPKLMRIAGKVIRSYEVCKLPVFDNNESNNQNLSFPF